MIEGTGSGPTKNPARAVLVGAAVPAMGVGLIFAAVAALAGRDAVASALLGSGLATGALAVGPAIMAMARNWPPPAVMLAAMVGYGVTIVAVAGVYVTVAPQEWVRGGYAGGGVLVSLIAWSVGHLRAVARLRFLAFGAGTQGDHDPRHDHGPADAGSPASPPQAPH